MFVSNHKRQERVEAEDSAETESAKKKERKKAVVEMNIPDCTFKSFCYETVSS